MWKARSPNIVFLSDYAFTSNNVYLVLELCEGGTLTDYLRAVKKIPEN